MRAKLCAAAFAATIIFAASQSGFGQNKARAYYQKGSMTEIMDLLWGQEDCSAESKRYGGTVSAVRFNDGDQIRSFTLRTTKGQIEIHLPPALYSERLSKKDAAALPTLVAKGKRITVDTSLCGGARKLILATYILAGIHMEVLG